MDMSVVYEQGVGQDNEDAYVVNHAMGRYAVIDGATGVEGLGGKVAADVIKNTLKEDAAPTLLDTVIKGNRGIKAATEEHFNQKLANIAKEYRTSCGMIAVEFDDSRSRMSYVHAGDCMLILQYKNSDIRVVTYDQIAKLDSTTINQFTQSIEAMTAHGEPLTDDLLKRAKQTIKPTLIQNRRQTNTSDGYGILDGTDDFINYIEYGTIPLINVQSILMLSDGLQLPTHKTAGQNSWLETGRYGLAHGLDALKDYITELENGDPFCTAYPRIKKADDKTGMLLDFNNK
ncbi:protein phosphatase 2C domain-containing protein [Tuberibacillus sp. Marseille-P3662]|uniref:protein phosphatase 2C domain-containing protein n=1 Tax=Tuberibacillus sp. Marseille-P3662 TaxID=1965358 RepID=UPI000A1CCB8D|nr:protein phosphatase 2C domain-containing protein [Tuberibacillus sp. Marseille-P3662]